MTVTRTQMIAIIYKLYIWYFSAAHLVIVADQESISDSIYCIPIAGAIPIDGNDTNC